MCQSEKELPAGFVVSKIKNIRQIKSERIATQESRIVSNRGASESLRT